MAARSYKGYPLVASIAIVHLLTSLIITVKRRNKWICALKTSLLELKIFGPTGDPDKEPAPKKYTEVPWKEVKAKEEAKRREAGGHNSFVKSEYDFADRNVACESLLRIVDLRSSGTDRHTL